MNSWNKKLLQISVSLLLILGFVAADNLDAYEGFKKYTVIHEDADDFSHLVNLQTEDPTLDFWLLSRNLSVISVDPQMQKRFESDLQRHGLRYVSRPVMDVMHSYNNSLSECDSIDCDKTRSKRQARGFFNHFPRYSEILNFMSALAARHPSYCRYESLGKSYENRHIAALSISLNPRVRARRVAYIQAGTHGREWITPLTVLYFANEILNNLRAFQSVLTDTELYLVPLVNPDGYEYTHTTDRFWRKNRHRYAGRSCVGVDINRNFANHWNFRGASQNLCSEVYSGVYAGSEPETAAITRYLEYNRNRVKLSVDVHSFGKFIFYPYGYSRGASAPTRNLLHSVAFRAASQIAKYRGTPYTIGTSAGILYEASGGLDDYAYGNLGIPMSFTVELPGENFQVASSDIIHICKETFAGLIEFVRHVSLF